MIHAVVLDSNTARRKKLRMLLNGAADVKVVGETECGEAIISKIGILRPEIAVLACQGPRAQATVADIRRRGLPTNIVAFNGAATSHHAREMIAAGATAYILEDELQNLLLPAVRSAARGQKWMSPILGARLVQSISTEPPEQVPLTNRELDVLRLIAAGNTNREIACALAISHKTVEKHVSGILTKLGVVSRVAAAVWAVTMGLA